MHCPYCLHNHPFHSIDCIHAKEHDRYPEDRYMEFVRNLQETLPVRSDLRAPDMHES